MDMKRDYYEDIRLLDSAAATVWFIVLLVALAVLPLFTPDYYLYMANYMAIHVIVTIGLDILVGYTGQISLAQAGFMGIGAYTVALLTTNGYSFWLALPLAAVTSFAIGVLLGFPSLKVKHHYLAMVTIGFNYIIYRVLMNELESYNEELVGRTRLVALNKVDIIDEERLAELKELFKKEEGVDLLSISAMEGEGLEDLKESISDILEQRAS